ncbi:MAG: hypothetical protein HDR27_02055 [Lachnospiraceae bacterium]|nr:hypothetical protein [Lachnospiraceae bacterium]
MNLTNFLKQTDAITAQYSKEQLLLFIHDIGRVQPEHLREDFLKRLKAIGDGSETTSNKDEVKGYEFNEMYKLVRNNLKIIDSQEVMLNGILNEAYDDWYDDGNEEFYYEDDSGISDMLAGACDFIHTCLDMEKYREGFEIGNQIFSMAILCVSEYGDEEFTLRDMVYHELLHCDLKQVILDTAYCAYYAVPLKKRPEALYEIIKNAGNADITLEAIMQHGDEELPDFQDFLTLWTACLGDKTGRDADRLILEAVDLLNDISSAVKYAEKYVAVHPGLYLNILENGKYTDVNDMVSIGMEAMELIPKKYIIRSKVALKTAEYITEANEKNSLLEKFFPLLEKCYFAAFESDTSASNYIRALLNGYETEKKREELQKVFMTLPVHKRGGFYGMFERDCSYSERNENKPDGNMILLLRFLDGQFADVLAKGLNKSEALGWTGTFMKQGIALYLLYLYEGQWSGKGIMAMAGIVKAEMCFSAEEYRKGTYGLNDTNEDDLFCELFLKWKSIVHMEPEVRNHALKRITALLEKRTEGIMSANRRNYYGECAAYIAALGEVQESLGDTGAKQRLMTSYKDKYSRRSAFREAMRNYGWRDVKRK